MEFYSSPVTQKGQITLPQAVRKSLGIKPKTRVSIVLKKGLVEVKAIPDIVDLAGSIKAPKHLDALKAREYMENHYYRA